MSKDISTERPIERISAVNGVEDVQSLINILHGYKEEAENDRKSGPGKRDDIWDANIALYWGDFSNFFKDKAEWQSKEVLPEIPMFVDRWAAAMREAINRIGEFFDVEMPKDPNGNFVPAIKKYIEYILSKSGRNKTGHPVSFSSTFEEMLKMSAMSAGVLSCTRKTSEDSKKSYTAIEIIDPRNVWLDAKGRGLYRIRNMEVDKHELLRLAKMKDKSEKDIWNVSEIELLVSHIDSDHRENAESISGSNTEASQSNRENITLDEYYCTVIDGNGDVLHENALIVVANDRFLVRGPEKNPFSHGFDWIVYSASITVPLSIYGKSYMENWAQIAVAFNEMTNLILDGVFTSTMNVFGMVSEKLKDPTQIEGGISPNMIFDFEEDTNIKEAFQSIGLGTMPPESVQVWSALKAELREGAAFNELSLGQVPPKGDITATEINASQQGSAVTTRSLARSIEENCLTPILNLAFLTDLQHLSNDDVEAKQFLGDEAFQALISRKKDFMNGSIKITVNGISALIERSEKLQKLIRTLEIIGNNDLLLKAFMEKYSIGKVMEEIVRLSGIDTMRLTPTPQERAAGGVVEDDESRSAAAAAALENQNSPQLDPNAVLQAITQQGNGGKNG